MSKSRFSNPAVAGDRCLLHHIRADGGVGWPANEITDGRRPWPGADPGLGFGRELSAFCRGVKLAASVKVFDLGA